MPSLTARYSADFLQNPDGTLQRAVMTQNALSKERREIKQQQREAQEDTIPKDIGKLWVDPVPEGMLFYNDFIILLLNYLETF